jgi:methylmalonyl-CoA mutase
VSRSNPFPPTDEADWQALATRGGETGLSSLASRSDDGLEIGPIYPAGYGPPLPGRPPGSRWTAVQRIDAGDRRSMAETARTAIKGGATGIALVFDDSASARGRGIALDPAALARLVGETPLTGTDLRIEVGDSSLGLAEHAVGALAKAGPRVLSLAFDAAATLAARGSLTRSFEDTVGALLTVFATMGDAGIEGRLIVADGRPWHDGGASEAQELAAVLAATVACLRQAEARGLELSVYARRLGVMLAADADQFVTIAKFRAMRLLFARMSELAGLPEAAVRVDAETSWRMMARRDAYLNMLRTGAAAFAAAAGGADSVAVLPFDLGSDSFAERMARNIQTISLEEASLFRVGDPGAGSGAIETLTTELARAGWEEFRAIEAEDGLPAAVRSGTIQARIAARREERFRKVARREIALVGVNVHVDRNQPQPLPAAPVPRPLADPSAAESAAPLEPARLAEPFERLCDKAEQLAASGRRPIVFMAGLGRPTDVAEAAGLAADALAAGGIESLPSLGFETPEAVATAFRDSGALVTCIVAVSGVSEGLITGTVAALRAEDAAFLVACGPSHDVGADASLTPASDLPAILEKLLDAIAISGKRRQNHAVH